MRSVVYTTFSFLCKMTFTEVNEKQNFSGNLIESWFFMDFHCFELPQLSLFQASESFRPSYED